MNEGGEIPQPPIEIDTSQPEIAGLEVLDKVSPQVLPEDLSPEDAEEAKRYIESLTQNPNQALNPQQRNPQGHENANQHLEQKKGFGLIKKLGLGALIMFFMNIFNAFKGVFKSDQQGQY